MTSVEDLDQVIERYQRALNELLKGNPEPNKTMFSHREDVTILNPIGSLAHGWEQVRVLPSALQNCLQIAGFALEVDPFSWP